MIEIKCAETTVALAECERLGLSLCTVYTMTDRGERLGLACAKGDGEETNVLYVEVCDAALTDALFRAVLNAERAKGAKTAEISDSFLVAHAQKRNYDVDTVTKRLNIADFFAKSVCKD